MERTLAVLAWMTRTELAKLPGLSALTDTGVAIFGALLLFFVLRVFDIRGEERILVVLLKVWFSIFRRPLIKEIIWFHVVHAMGVAFGPNDFEPG